MRKCKKAYARWRKTYPVICRMKLPAPVLSQILQEFSPYKLWEVQDTGKENDNPEIWVQLRLYPKLCLFYARPYKTLFWVVFNLHGKVNQA